MRQRLVDQVAMTVSSYEPQYTFIVEINDWALEAMKSESILGFKFRKNKYKFLNELGETLAQAIVEKFEEME